MKKKDHLLIWILAGILLLIAFYGCSKQNAVTPSNAHAAVNDSTHISITLQYKGNDSVQYYFTNGYGSLGGWVKRTPTVFNYTYPAQPDSCLFLCTSMGSQDSVWFSAIVNSKPIKSISTTAFAFHYK